MSADRRAATGGFTLLEVLVAMGILGLAVVASIQGFAQGLRLLKLSGDHQQAALLADRKLREVVTPTEGHDRGAEGGFRWERAVTLVETPELTPAGRAPAWRVYRIDVRVQWDASRQVELATLRTVPVEHVPIVPAGGPAAPAPAPGGARR